MTVTPTAVGGSAPGSPASTPEPATLALAGLGLGAVLARRLAVPMN